MAVKGRVVGGGPLDRGPGPSPLGRGMLARQPAHPDTLGGGFAEMAAGRAVAGDGKLHRLVILAMEDADSCGRAQGQMLEEFEELGIFFIHTQHFIGVPHRGFGKTHGAVLSPERGHPAEKWHAVGAAAIAAEALQQKAGNLGGDAVFESFGFFVRARPFEADDVGEELFREPVTQDKVLCNSLSLRRKLDASTTTDAQIAAASHTLERGRDGGRSDPEILSQSRADGHLLLLDDLPNCLQIIFL
jgi:hypothetical protein